MAGIVSLEERSSGSDDVNNAQKSDRNGINGIIDMGQGNSVMAAVMRARDISEGIDDSDDSSGKVRFPSTRTPRTRPRINNATSSKDNAKACLPNPRGGIRRQRRQSSSDMTSDEINSLTSLMHFVSNHHSERVNLLQIAMAPFEVCYRSHTQRTGARLVPCSVMIFAIFAGPDTK